MMRTLVRWIQAYWPLGLIAMWVPAVVTGMWVLYDYSNSAGSAGQPPLRLTSMIGDSPTAPAKFQMFVFLHPHCPCSMATARELRRLLTTLYDQVHIDAYFYRPSEQSDDWAHTACWHETERDPAIRCLIDVDGQISRAFGAYTSGHVLLYDTSGALRFSGGITSGRGHEGTNAGTQAIRRAVATRDDATPIHLPVFGCAITKEES